MSAINYVRNAVNEAMGIEGNFIESDSLQLGLEK